MVDHDLLWCTTVIWIIDGSTKIYDYGIPFIMVVAAESSYHLSIIQVVANKFGNIRLVLRLQRLLLVNSGG